MNKWLYLIAAGFFFFLAFNIPTCAAVFGTIAFLLCMAAAMDVYALPEKKSESETMPILPAPESNGEELAPETAVHYIRIPAEEANTDAPEGCNTTEWDEVRRMGEVAPCAVEGGKITLEILK